jgi:hypothetical protein
VWPIYERCLLTQISLSQRWHLRSNNRIYPRTQEYPHYIDPVFNNCIFNQCMEQICTVCKYREMRTIVARQGGVLWMSQWYRTVFCFIACYNITFLNSDRCVHSGILYCTTILFTIGFRVLRSSSFEWFLDLRICVFSKSRLSLSSTAFSWDTIPLCGNLILIVFSTPFCRVTLCTLLSMYK